jgi:UDP-N-acetylmuramoyl-tripeptide--D-alanyl-D-alanine ligase
MGSMFFALRGENFNGNHFAADALADGASWAVVDDPEFVTGEKCLLVEDSLATLQALAARHRNQVKAKIIGITGSNGKTTTKELTGAVLSAKYKTVYTKGNLNNHIGVPLTILSITYDTEFAIVEMGANHQGEIAALCEIAKPRYGIITNIGKAHLEGFGGYEGVIRAKSELFNYIRYTGGTVFVNLDNSQLCSLSEGIDRVTYGKSPEAGCSGAMLADSNVLGIGKSVDGRQEQIITNLIGAYNFENVMAAICIGDYFKVPFPLIKLAVERYLPENNRSQKIDTGRNTIILDAYNANPSSMKAALENFATLPGKNKMVILGDMMELGEEAAREHTEILSLLAKLGLYEVALVGELFKQAAIDIQIPCFSDVAGAGEWLSAQKLANRTILLKGSRKMQLEKLTAYV